MSGPWPSVVKWSFSENTVLSAHTWASYSKPSFCLALPSLFIPMRCLISSSSNLLCLSGNKTKYISKNIQVITFMFLDMLKSKKQSPIPSIFEVYILLQLFQWLCVWYSLWKRRMHCRHRVWKRGAILGMHCNSWREKSVPFTIFIETL